MADYTLKHALIDIGFLVGYLKMAIVSKQIADEDEGLWYLLEQVDDLAVKGRLHDNQSPEEADRMLVMSVGELKGRIWHTPVAHAVSDAIDRLSLHYANHWIGADEAADNLQPVEALGDKLSDHQRHQLTGAAINTDEDTSSPEFAERIGAPLEGVVSYWQSLGVIEEDEAVELLNNAAGAAQKSAPTPRNTREWTPEQRAAAAERAKGQKKPPFDNDLESVKADFDSGMPLDRIGRKFGCSGSHIRNFLSKHGIDPRRKAGGAGKNPDPLGSEQPVEEEPAVEQVIEHEEDQLARDWHSIPRAEYEWKQEERERVIELRATGISWAKIGEMMGRTGSSCSAMYHHLKHKDPSLEVKSLTQEEFNANVSAGATEAWAERGRRITDDDLETVREMVAQGRSMNVIGNHFNCGHQSVINFCTKHNIERTDPPAGLTQNDIPAVQEMLDKDCDYEAIGEWFGCDAERVRQFCQDHRLIPAKLQEEVTNRYKARQAGMASQTQVAVEENAITASPHQDSPASRWKPSPIDPGDWPDIQRMLAAGQTREAIAGDYDVSIEDLEGFIEQQLEATRARRTAKEPPLGEARAAPELNGRCEEKDSDAAKVEAFLRERGVTRCQSVAIDIGAPVRGGPDDSVSDWLNRRRDAPETDESKLAKAKLVIMLRNLGGQPVEMYGNRSACIAHLRLTASRWFFERSDFNWWCEAAGFEPEYVRENARRIYEHGLPAKQKSTADINAYMRTYQKRKRRNLG